MGVLLKNQNYFKSNYMETNHGSIEHEKSLIQGGKRKQNEDSAKNYIIGVIVVVLVAFYLLVKLSLK